MRVKDVMTQGVECVRPTESIARAARRMRELNVGSLPVCGDHNKLVGMITDRDITVRATANACEPTSTCVCDAMTPDVCFCFDDDEDAGAAHLMEEHQIRRLVVLDRNKRLVGIVSLGDLVVRGSDEWISAEALERVSEPAMPAR